MESYKECCEYWAANDQTIILSVKPIALVHAIRAAFYNTRNKLGSSEAMIGVALKAFETFPLDSEFELSAVDKSLSIYSKICQETWAEQSMTWLFILSLRGGYEGIMTWQKLFRTYSDAVSELK